MKKHSKIRRFIASFLVVMLFLINGLQGFTETVVSNENVETVETQVEDVVLETVAEPAAVTDETTTNVDESEDPVELETTQEPLPSEMPIEEIEELEEPQETLENEETVEDLHFSAGYVRLEKNCIIYEKIDGKVSGTIKDQGVVFAELIKEASEPAEDWLRITFDTQKLREDDADFVEAYVQYKQVEALTTDEINQLVAEFENDDEIRWEKNELFYVPCVDYEKKESASSDTVNLSDLEELFSNITENTAEASETEALYTLDDTSVQGNTVSEIIGVWYDKGIEERPLQIHVTTSLDAQVLYLYQGNDLLASLKASEADIDEYATCKEWHVSYTFAYSGAYYLWYKASADGTAMSSPYTPDPVEIERPAVIDVWYEKGIEGEPLKIHATTNLDMQYLYLYLGEDQVASWNAKEAEIVEYATCKEWIVSYTFADPGAYYLWYKASADGIEMSLPYSTAAAQIERPAVIEVWYEKGLENKPLKIHATTNLDMQYLYLYLGENQLESWSAANAEIVEYATCKEWVVSYTFADPGAYYLWYKASEDGEELSQAYAPAAAQIERPAIIEVWYEDAAVNAPLKIHATTNLEIQHLYLYLGESLLKEWQADEAEIVDYATCKEWTVEYTFNDAGTYYLWYKASKDGTTEELPFAPDPVYIGNENLSAPTWSSVAQANQTVVLNWQAVEGATGYEVSMCQSGSDQYTVIGETQETSFTTGTLAAGTTCVFRVRAYAQVDGEKVYSPYSEDYEITIEKSIMTFGDFTYELNEAGTGVVITAYNGSDAEVIVPDTINNIPVTEIGAEAFMGNTTMKKITLPQTIERIGVRAFKNCTALSEMN